MRLARAQGTGHATAGPPLSTAHLAAVPWFAAASPRVPTVSHSARRSLAPVGRRSCPSCSRGRLLERLESFLRLRPRASRPLGGVELRAPFRFEPRHAQRAI